MEETGERCSDGPARIRLTVRNGECLATRQAIKRSKGRTSNPRFVFTSADSSRVTISLLKNLPVRATQSNELPLKLVPSGTALSPALVLVDGRVTIYLADCIEVLRALPAGSVDAVVTDPPYAIGAVRDPREMFKSHIGGPCTGCRNRAASDGYELCEPCLDLAEASALMEAPMLGMQSQNWHEKATHSRGYADNNNQQFQRWCLLWARECHRVLKPGGHLVAFGGTRTWHRLASAIEDAGFTIRDNLAWLFATGFPKSMDVAQAITKAHANRQPGAGQRETPIDAKGSREDPGQEWRGWGTALKPAHEPIVLARKPLDGTVANNVARYGTGALNIDACRVTASSEGGRWPSNVFMDSYRADMLDEQGNGHVSRFFWVAKPDQSERVHVGGVSHPTVKPLTLMRELIKLVTSPGGTVLEPFAGSGTTVEACLVEGFNVIAVEKDPSYLPLIRERLDRRIDPVRAMHSMPEQPGLFDVSTADGVEERLP